MIWYLFMAMLEDESAQKKGIVMLQYLVGRAETHPKFLDLFKYSNLLTEGLPFRVAGVHFCYDLRELRPFMFLAQQVASRDYRVRFRAHYGTFHW